jgi:hypothetical protein
MRYIARCAVVLLLVVSLLVPMALAAETQDETQVELYDENRELNQSVVFIVGRNEYFLNGQTPGIKMNAAPFIENGRTFVPIRYLGYSLGLTPDQVKWSSELKAAILNKGEKQIRMTIGSKLIWVNNQPQLIDVAPILKPVEYRTYLPARYVVEALGYQVEWQPPDLVLAWPKGAPKPDVRPVKDYLGKPLTVAEQGQIIYDEAKPYKANAVLTDFKTHGGDGVFPAEPVMRVTLDELRERGVQMDKYYTVLDLWVDEEKNFLHIKYAGAEEGPVPSRPWIVEEIDGEEYMDLAISTAPKEFDHNPFVYDYGDEEFKGLVTTGSYPGTHTPRTVIYEDITKAKAFMIQGAETWLYVPNPAYKGGK